MLRRRLDTKSASRCAVSGGGGGGIDDDDDDDRSGGWSAPAPPAAPAANRAPSARSGGGAAPASRRPTLCGAPPPAAASRRRTRRFASSYSRDENARADCGRCADIVPPAFLSAARLLGPVPSRSSRRRATPAEEPWRWKG
jgi:hypothetical protein